MKTFSIIFSLLSITICVSDCGICPCEEKKCDDPNEEYILAKYGELTCDGQSPKPCTPVYECRCKSGFVRHQGKCINPCDCPKKCSDPYEEYIWTKTGEETCDGVGPKPCLPIQACRCISGFVRHGGKCIRKSECPPKCTGENEEYVFTKYEDRTCNGAAVKSCTAGYACRCIEGYVRENGKCIRECDCPSKCNDFEEYVWAIYGEETCSGTGPAPCQPVKECRCIAGYVRHEGKCIKRCDCPPKCKDPNEEFVWSSHGEETCDGEKPPPCSPVQECRCRRGYVRHEGKCIRKCDCPPKCSDPYEEYVYTKYEDETCSGTKPALCEPVNACRCIKGYVRHEGKCIRKCDCPPKCQDPNEIYTYTKYGDLNCDGEQEELCEPKYACRCRQGYVRHEGKCIKQCDCPSKCKDPFEEYILAETDEATCDNPNPKSCKPVKECRCIPGYVRHEGKCIRQNECPPKCKDPNEVYITTRWEDETCDGRGPPLRQPVTACRCRNGYVRHGGVCIRKCDCPPKCTGEYEEYITATTKEATCDVLDPEPCDPVTECRCIPGYVRHQGKCIKSCDCPAKCSDPNEIYIYTQYEDATCDGPQPPKCEPTYACRCRRGYVRHEGKCIKPCDCPSKCKDPFEEYVTATVGERTCNGRNPDPCKPVTECRCISGYVRHEGKCIRECDCPPKCKDPNEIFVKTSYGEPTCDDQNPGPLCKPVEECRCRNGYVRHNGKCIKPCDCPRKCADPNEEYVTTMYEDRTCNNLIPLPMPCGFIKACRCKKGYVRNNGKCIKESECPCGENEVWSDCAPIDQETCYHVPVANNCLPGCMCLPGYVRNCENKCIKRCECPKP